MRFFSYTNKDIEPSKHESSTFMFRRNYNSERGLTLIVVLAFTGVFMLSVAALMNFVLMQSKLGLNKGIRAQALGVAEAGLSYYNWFLAHYPNNLQDGTGVAGPYVHTYTDPVKGDIGSYSLSVKGNLSCGQVQSIDVTSTGTINADPRFKRVLKGRHAAPSVADYSYIIGENVWAGSDRQITGKYHSNGGIRMDGTNNSLVTSGVSSWTCDGSFGCSPTQTKQGIFGSGSGSALWKYPTSKVSFADMATNLPNMKAYAESSGIYLPPYGSTEVYFKNPYGGSNYTAIDGYHLVFNADGTVDIYQVTSTSGYWGYRSGIGYTADFNIIDSESFLERRTVPTGCSLIFVEDKVWIDGVVKGKVTVVSADLINNNYKTDVILNNNITYTKQDGTDGLTVISQNAILIPPRSPNDLTINGIFVAEGDRFGRPYYDYDKKNSLTIHGSIISNKRVGTSWSCGWTGYFCSGYSKRITTYDRLQATNPPPFTPSSTTTPRYILWQEK